MFPLSISYSSTFIKSAAFAYKDSYSGAGALGGSDSSVDINQTVTPASVSSGDVFEFSVWLRGTAAMSANLTLAEYDVGGSNDSSTNAYTIVANEYWTFHRVRHQITDAASDRMVVGININDAGTLYVDNAVLQRNGTMNVNTVDLQFVINDGKASEAAQDTVLLRDLHIEGIDFSEGDEYNTLSFNFFSFTDVPDIS